MAVQTPSYWQEEQYRPLVEATTAYGNKVQIPERWRSICEFHNTAIKQGKQSHQVYVDGLKEMIQRRGMVAADFARVMLEIYQEPK